MISASSISGLIIRAPAPDARHPLLGATQGSAGLVLPSVPWVILGILVFASVVVTVVAS